MRKSFAPSCMALTKPVFFELVPAYTSFSSKPLSFTFARPRGIRVASFTTTKSLKSRCSGFIFSGNANSYKSISAIASCSGTMSLPLLELKYPCVPAALTTKENSSPKLFNGKPKFSGSDQVESESLLAMKKSDPPIDGLRSETKYSVVPSKCMNGLRSRPDEFTSEGNFSTLDQMPSSSL